MRKPLPRKIKSPPPIVVGRSEVKADGWANVLTGIGMAGKDKRIGEGVMKITPDLLNRETLESIWRGDDISARVVETVPNEMMREGYDIKIQVDDVETDQVRKVRGDNAAAKDQSEAVMAALETLGTNEAVLEALQYERAYGGAAIMLGVDDGAPDLSQPLQLDKVRSIKWLTVLAAHELTPTQFYGDPLAPRFGEPMVYRLHPEAPVGSSVSAYVEVHESRMVLFKGVKVSRRQMRANSGWGDSVLVRVWQVIADYQQSWGAAAILMQDFAAAVLKVKDLAELISTNQDDVVVKRAQIMELCRSVARAIIIDADEEYERKVTPLTGLPDMLDKFALRVASAADMPVALLMGQAPAGLNATGASDIRFFYDRIASRQKSKLTPALKKIASVVMAAKDGPTRGKIPDNWTIIYHALWQMDEGQKADVRYKQAQTDQIEITTGVVTPEEIAVSRHGGDQWSCETVIDFEAREPIKPPAHVLEETKAKAKASAFGGGGSGGDEAGA